MYIYHKIVSVVLKEKILKFREYVSAILLFSLWEKTWPFKRNKLESSSPKDAFYQSLVKIGLVVLERNNFKFCQCIFTISELSTL